MTVQFSQERHGAVLVLAPRGRLDNESAADFELLAQELLAAGERHLVVDLSQLNYISNAGLRVLGILGKALRTPATSLRVCGLTPPLMQVFDAAGASAMFEMRPDLRRAIADHPAAQGASELVSEAMRLLGITPSTTAPVDVPNVKTLAALAVELLAGGIAAPRAARAMAAGTQVVARVRPQDEAAALAAQAKPNWLQRLFGKRK